MSDNASTRQRPPSGEGSLERVVTIPNAVSLLRLLLVPVFTVALLRHHDLVALGILAFSGFTDWLDGFLARTWQQESRVGQLLDPMADRLFILCTLVVLAMRNLVPWWLVAVLVGRDLVLTLFLPFLAKYRFGPLPVHFLGKAATFNLLYAFPLLVLGEGTSVLAHSAKAIGWGFAGWGTGLYLWAGVLYLKQAYEVTRPYRVTPAKPSGHVA